MKLNVQAIFDSIDGEENGFGGAGELTTFIRLKGCNLRCTYCDTKYAQEVKPPNWMTVDEVFKQVHFSKVTITGGEPMLQWRQLGPLLEKLFHTDDYKVTIETNGSVFLPPWVYGHEFNWVWTYSKGLRYVVDYKLPSSGENHKMCVKLFENLQRVDVVKFVILDESDYNFAKSILSSCPSWKAKIVFSPTINLISTVLYSVVSQSSDPKFETEVFKFIDSEWPRQLAEMMIKDKVNAQFGLQLHKILWSGAKEER